LGALLYFDCLVLLLLVLFILRLLAIRFSLALPVPIVSVLFLRFPLSGAFYILRLSLLFLYLTQLLLLSFKLLLLFLNLSLLLLLSIVLPFLNLLHLGIASSLLFLYLLLLLLSLNFRLSLLFLYLLLLLLSLNFRLSLLFLYLLPLLSLNFRLPLLFLNLLPLLPLNLRLPLLFLNLPLLLSLSLRPSLILLHLLLMPLHLRLLPVVLLPLHPYFLDLSLRPGSIALHAPCFVSLPVLIVMPLFPVVLQPPMGNPFVVPPVTVPGPGSVVVSPIGVDVIIKTRNIIVIAPVPVVGARAVPAALPWAPPPAIPEKQVELALRNHIDIAGVRQNDDLRGPLKVDRLRQAKPDVYIDLRPEGLRQDDGQGQQEYSHKYFVHRVASLVDIHSVHAFPVIVPSLCRERPANPG